MSEWQPIETAPKDGTWFVALPRAEMGFGAAEGFIPYPPTVCHIKVSRRYDHWAEIEVDHADVCCKAMNCWTAFGLDDFTHWMPLPPPPQEQPE